MSSAPMSPAAALPLLATTVVGSFPQPEWLVDRAALLSGGVPRVPRPGLWRMPDELRELAHDDAVRLAVRDLERAGVDIVSDGEVRRESYFSWLAPALTGLDVERPGTAIESCRTADARAAGGGPHHAAEAGAGAAHRVLARGDGPPDQGHRARPVHADRADAERALSRRAESRHGLRGRRQRRSSATSRPPAPISSSSTSPTCRPGPIGPASTACAAIDRALEGIAGPTVVHLCFGYAHTVREKPSGYSYLPELERCRATHISDRGGAAAARLRHPGRAAVEDHRFRCARPGRRRRSRRPRSWPAESGRPWLTCRPSASCRRRTAA